MPNLVKIYLGGKLGKLFGPNWELSIGSTVEVLKAIDTMSTITKFKKSKT